MAFSIEISVEKPGIAESLSIVPPEKPRPRPLILITGTPKEATAGASISVVVSPTPPVECLSVLIPGISEKSSILPLWSMAFVI